MEKFAYSEIDNFFKSKSYTAQTEQSYRSTLTELYNIVNVYGISESIESMLTTRMFMGKSPANIKRIRSVVESFVTFTSGNSTQITQNSEKFVKSELPKKEQQIAKIPTFEELKQQFAKNVLKISREIKNRQNNESSDPVDKMVSFYIREGKQLLKLYGFLSEKQLLDTIHARFNKKPSDVETVKGIISDIIPTPSQKTLLELPQKGKFLEYIKAHGTTTETKTQILEQYPDIDPNSLNVEDSIPKEDPKYIWLKGERDIICALLLHNENLWVTGSAGLGKSTMLLQFAYEEQIPIVRTGCNYEADPSDQFYEQGFNGHKVIFQAQNIGKSFLFSRMIGASIEVEEELNSSNEGTMIILHSATDDIKSLDTKIGKIHLQNNCKCLIAGTGNIGYKGTSDLTPALQSRLIPMEKQEPTEKFILENIWK